MSERDPRFGENFNPDTRSRLDPLREGEKPQYVVDALDVRLELIKVVEEKGWPEVPRDLTGVEDFFERAKAEVDQAWQEKVTEILTKKCQKWLETIPQTPENQSMIDTLSNPEELESKLRIRQFGVLEDLRKGGPEMQVIWRELVLISSERQLAEINLTHRWVRELHKCTPEEQGSLAQKIGVKSLAELDIFIDTAALLGKYIDHAYVKQIELADAPGGSKKTKLGDQKVAGNKRLYDIYTSNENDDVIIKSYADVFPYEWEKIYKNFKILEDRVVDSIQAGELDEERYGDLSAYLHQMAETYNSKTIDPQSLFDQWQSLMQNMTRLAQKDCPVMLVPQGCASVAGEANKVDVEMRLGFRTERARALEKELDRYRHLAQEILNGFSDAVLEVQELPPVMLNYQPFAFGPNLYWMTRGESGKQKIISHTNAVREVAVNKEIPLLEKLFTHSLDQEMYTQASIIETTRHEVSHPVLSAQDEKIKERIGSSTEATIAEELKAETVSMKLLQESIKRGYSEKIPVETQLMAKLGGLCDYMANKSSVVASSGERYYYCGVAIISRLLDSGALTETPDGRYHVQNSTLAVDEMAKIGDELLVLYSTKTPTDLEGYVKKIRTQADDPRIKKFVERLKK